MWCERAYETSAATVHADKWHIVLTRATETDRVSSEREKIYHQMYTYDKIGFKSYCVFSLSHICTNSAHINHHRKTLSRFQALPSIYSGFPSFFSCVGDTCHVFSFSIEWLQQDCICCCNIRFVYTEFLSLFFFSATTNYKHIIPSLSLSGAKRLENKRDGLWAFPWAWRTKGVLLFYHSL